MLSFTRAGRVVLLASMFMFAGCDNLVQPPRRGAEQATESSSVRLPGVSMETARATAVAVMKEHFRIDQTASTATLLISRPSETSERADKETAGIAEVLSGSSNRHRQLAQISLTQRGADVVVRCNVQTQRLDAAEHRAFMPQQSGDDRPANQPTDHSRGTQTVSEGDWTNVGRNRQLEREMLNEIADRLAPEVARQGGAATQPQ